MTVNLLCLRAELMQEGDLPAESLDDKINRAFARIMEIDEQIESLRETKTVTSESLWQIIPGQRRIHSRTIRTYKDGGRVMQLRAEKAGLQELVRILSKEKAAAIVGVPLPHRQENTGDAKKTKDAISWCVRRARELKSAKEPVSQSGLASEAVGKYFPEVQEFTGETGKTGKPLKNPVWLKKKESIRKSYLAKIPGKRKPPRALE